MSSNSSSAFNDASSNDIFGRFLKSLTFFGCELSLAPMIVRPLSLMLPVNGMLNKSSASASLSTNYSINQDDDFFSVIFMKSMKKVNFIQNWCEKFSPCQSLAALRKV